MVWEYAKLKKYEFVLDQLKKVVDYDLNPHVATNEEMEGALEYAPQLLAKLKEIYEEEV